MSNKKKLSAFSRNVKRLRLKAGLTQKQLVVKLGMSVKSHRYIGKIESGDRGNNPGVDTLKKFAAVFGIKKWWKIVEEHDAS